MTRRREGRGLALRPPLPAKRPPFFPGRPLPPVIGTRNSPRRWRGGCFLPTEFFPTPTNFLSRSIVGFQSLTELPRQQGARPAVGVGSGIHRPLERSNRRSHRPSAEVEYGSRKVSSQHVRMTHDRQNYRSAQQRTRQHVIADLSIHFVEGFILTAGHTAQRLSSDYGYDLMAWTFDEHGFVEPGAIYFQFKAREHLEESGTDYVFDLDIRDYHLWVREKMPVILILFDATRRLRLLACRPAVFRRECYSATEARCEKRPNPVAKTSVGNPTGPSRKCAN